MRSPAGCLRWIRRTDRRREHRGFLSPTGDDLPGAFDEDDVDTVTRLASYVSSAIALARDLARVNNEILELAK
jgi:GAF domain-containing protein